MIYEQRHYRAMPGRMPDLLRRFEHDLVPLWQRHGIEVVGFWTVVVGDAHQDIHYLLRWQSMAEREDKWQRFLVDPEWIERRARTEERGPIVSWSRSAFLQPTQFSKLQ